jgi:hypothetical protein
MALHVPWLLKSVFQYGCAFVARKRIKRAMRATGAVFWKKRLLKFGFWGWVLGLAQRDGYEQAKEHARCEYQGKLLGRVFACMHMRSQDKIQGRMAQTEKLSFARDQLNASMRSRYMHTWCSAHAKLVIKRMQNAIARGRRTHTLAGKLVKYWRQIVEEIVLVRAKCQRMLALVGRHNVKACFDQWSNVAQYYFLRKYKGSAAARLYCCGLVAWCVGVWHR